MKHSHRTETCCINALHKKSTSQFRHSQYSDNKNKKSGTYCKMKTTVLMHAREGISLGGHESMSLRYNGFHGFVETTHANLSFRLSI